MSTTTETPKRPVNRLRHAWWMVGLVVVVLLVAQWVGDRVDEKVAVSPLVAAERASTATGRPIKAMTPEQAQDLVAGTPPTEAEVTAYVGPGNAYLEPAYYADQSRSLEFDRDADRCYFLVAAPDARFDPAEVTSLGRVCYVDGVTAPHSFSLYGLG